MAGEPRWLVLAWRLPHGSSTPRVTLWRSLKRLGAATLTPGAALVPYREEMLEQLSWLAQEVEEQGGDAWILPVTELAEDEESRVRDQVNTEREAEYQEVEESAIRLASRGPQDPSSAREVRALLDRLDRIAQRDHFGASGQRKARRAVERTTAMANSVGRTMSPLKR